MRKRATGLTSIPIPDVPGSENVEIKDIESEDAEVANHGGFNQMEPSNFAKDLEIVKRMMRLKKKASEIFTDLDAVQDAASRFGVQINSEDPQEIFKYFLKDIVLKTDVYWGYGDFPAEAPVTVKKKIVTFWEDLWKNNSSISPNAYKDFLYANVDRKFLETLGAATVAGAGIGAGAGALIGGVGAVPGALVGGAAGLLGGLASQWNDEEIGRVEDFYNVLFDYKKNFSKKSNQTASSSALSSDPSSTSSNTSAGSISYPAGTKLKDIVGDYSYKVISPSEVEITRADGSTVTVTPDTASDNNVDWDIMVSSLNDSSQTEVVKSANNIFNITKVSKDMKNELIKLNAALNGLGYRDLVKVAEKYTINGTSIDISSPRKGETEEIYKERVGREIENSHPDLYSTTESLENSDDIEEYIDNEWYNFKEMQKASVNTGGNTGDNTGGSGRGSGGGTSTSRGALYAAKNWEEYAVFNKDKKASLRSQIKDLWLKKPPEGYNAEYSSYQKWWARKDGGNGGSVEDVLVKLQTLNPQAASAAAGRGVDLGEITVILTDYLTKPLLSAQFPEREKIIEFVKSTDPNAIGVSDGNKRYIKAAMAEKLLSRQDGIAYVKAIYDSDLKNDADGSKALRIRVTPSPDLSLGSTSPSASTTGGQSQQQQAGKVSQKIVINGQQRDVVSIGTWGKDQLYLVPSSLATGNPEIYRFDNKTQSYSRLDKSKLGPRETAAMIRALNSYKKLEPNQEKALREYFGSVRSNTGIRSLVTTRNERQTETRKNKKGEEIKGTSEDLKEGFTGYASASTRQSRLDNLRKKGVI